MLTVKQRLLSFIDVATEVQGYRYAARVQEEGIPHLSFGCDQSGLTSDRGWPEEENVRELLLTLRITYLERDDQSLCKLERDISSLPDTPEIRQHKAGFLAVVHLWKASLDGPPAARHAGGLTRNDILNVALYGHYTHRNLDREEPVYRSWKAGPIFDVLRWELDLILIDYLAVLNRLKYHCEQIVEHI